MQPLLPILLHLLLYLGARHVQTLQNEQEIKPSRLHEIRLEDSPEERGWNIRPDEGRNSPVSDAMLPPAPTSDQGLP